MLNWIDTSFQTVISCNYLDFEKNPIRRSFLISEILLLSAKSLLLSRLLKVLRTCFTLIFVCLMKSKYPAPRFTACILVNWSEKAAKRQYSLTSKATIGSILLLSPPDYGVNVTNSLLSHYKSKINVAFMSRCHIVKDWVCH